jgi:hypothetical protein
MPKLCFAKLRNVGKKVAMKLIDQFYTPEPVDTYTFVFDDMNPETGQYTMLPMRQDTFAYSQFVEGDYDPDGENPHLGQRVLFHELGELVMDRFFSRLGSRSGEGRIERLASEDRHEGGKQRHQ